MQKNYSSLINDARIYEVTRRIGIRFGLNIDQIGEMEFEVQKIMIGETQRDRFVENLMEALQLSREFCTEIANALNGEILSRLDSMLGNDDADGTYEEHVSALEKAGGFEIERPGTPIPVRKSLNLLEDEPAQSEAVEEKRDIMAGIENPEPSTMKVATDPAESAKKEPLVEQLLRGTTAVPEQKIVRGPVPPRSTGTDPYREAVE